MTTQRARLLPTTALLAEMDPHLHPPDQIVAVGSQLALGSNPQLHHHPLVFRNRAGAWQPSKVLLISIMSQSEGSSQGPGICELCRRSVSELTIHHLIPKTRHKNKKNKKDFDRTEVKQRLASLCRPCHKTVHAELTEKELERQYNTIVQLRGHPGIEQFCSWIANKPDGFDVPVRQSKAKRDRRQRR